MFKKACVCRAVSKRQLAFQVERQVGVAQTDGWMDGQTTDDRPNMTRSAVGLQKLSVVQSGRKKTVDDHMR